MPAGSQPIMLTCILLFVPAIVCGELSEYGIGRFDLSKKDGCRSLVSLEIGYDHRLVESLLSEDHVRCEFDLPNAMSCYCFGTCTEKHLKHACVERLAFKAVTETQTWRTTQRVASSDWQRISSSLSATTESPKSINHMLLWVSTSVIMVVCGALSAVGITLSFRYRQKCIRSRSDRMSFLRRMDGAIHSASSESGSSHTTAQSECDPTEHPQTTRQTKKEAESKKEAKHRKIASAHTDVFA